MLTQAILEALNKWYQFPENKVYCQICTIQENKPHVRTMDLYEITENGCLVFFTDTSTRKCLDLQTCPNIAVCITHLDHGQIIVEGTATLATRLTDSKLANYYWHNFLDQYWRDFYLSRAPSSKADEIPPSFGIVTIKPNFGEILEVNPIDFLQGSRIQFHFVDGVWNSRNVSLS